MRLIVLSSVMLLTVAAGAADRVSIAERKQAEDNRRFAAQLFIQINLARLDNDVTPVVLNSQLSAAAKIEAEWTVLAIRHGLLPIFPLHKVSTAWLLDERPDLDWLKLYATYGPDLPTQLGSFDVARLCGYEGLCRDNIGQANKTAENAVTGWLRSPGHRANLLDPAWREVGCARSGGGQGAVCVAVFGSLTQEP